MSDEIKDETAKAYFIRQLEEANSELATLRTALAAAQADSARLDWLEQTAKGTGESCFLRSIFIGTDHDSNIMVDVKMEPVIIKPTLRAAIDSAMKPTP